MGKTAQLAIAGASLLASSIGGCASNSDDVAEPGAQSVESEARVCFPGALCQPANTCKTGRTVCSRGLPICVESGNKPAGTTCGSGLACNAAGTCGCPSSTTSCNGACVDLTTDANNCGACGLKCSTGSVCLKGSCTQCIPNASCGTATQCKPIGTCNATGTACVQPALANNTVCTSPKSGICTNGDCACYHGPPLTCVSGQGSTCTSWSFESNTLEGWAVDTTDPNNTAFVANLGVSAAPAGGTAGTRALSFNYRPGPNGGDVVLLVPLCDAQGVQFNATINTYAFSLFFMDNGTTPPLDQFGFQAFQVFHAPTFEQVITANTANTIQSGAWISYTTQLFAGETDREASVGIVFHFTQTWSGTIFVDNVHF